MSSSSEPFGNSAVDFDLPRDMVVHAISRSPIIPHLSPYVLKLECWLRLHRIPYTFTSKQPMHPIASKLPWLEYDKGRIQLWDTESIFAFLQRDLSDTPAMLERSIDAGMSPQEHATMRAFQRMIDEHMSWGLPIWRFVRDPEWSIWKGPAMTFNPALKFIARYFLSRGVRKVAYGQGLGRHDDSVLTERISEDLQAVSDFLAQKPFLMGDKVRSVDCALFAHLAQLLYVDTTSPYTAKIRETWPNLVTFTVRMRNLCYPDWNLLLNEVQEKNGMPLL